MIKKILLTTDPYTTILKSRMQEKLHSIISENQSTAIKKDKNFKHSCVSLCVT